MSMHPDDRDPVLDADTLARLHEAVARSAGADDARVLARVRSKLLRRVAAASTPRHVTVQADAGHWRHAGPGLELKVLHREAGIMSYLVRMAPGSKLPPHRHPVDEECVVLEGEVVVGTDLRIAAGGFHLGRKDVLHDVVSTDTGALIFLRGAVLDDEHLI
jgi:quercetin dioxygenase-like cupin family protein